MAERIMLNINHIAKTFNPGTITEKRALTDVDLKLNEGDFVTIIGGNGAGKSTTLNAVAGVFAVDQGTIEIAGVDVTRLPEYKRAKYLGRVFQDPMTGTAATMNIEENMALAMRRGEKRTLRWGISNMERDMYREQLRTLGLGLEERMSSKVGLLSGGQRQALTLLMAAHAEAAAAGRAYGGARPEDRREGFGADRKDRRRAEADRDDGHPQHEGRDCHGQPPDYDERGAHCGRCARGGEEEAHPRGSDAAL